ncbi:hypothetical protein BK662_09895 [Pseudomonas frederiksbergensis]|uniref:Uncharacterized protein n=1 Tax=Pseudomonas frederiksbergensis TaxID=104087 RepID=A0A423HUH8_9PSED|nr:hypothetical protein BK662_09895 [Pseudomonas frederiksbergensis]
MICGFPQNAQELFFMFPKAHFPLTETQLITAISQRFDVSVCAIHLAYETDLNWVESAIATSGCWKRSLKRTWT